MTVVYVGRRDSRKGPLILCHYDSDMAAALGWTRSVRMVLMVGRLYSVLVRDLGTEWDTVEMASRHRDGRTLLSLRHDCCWHHDPLRKPGMGQEWSDMAEAAVHKR